MNNPYSEFEQAAPTSKRMNYYLDPIHTIISVNQPKNFADLTKLVVVAADVASFGWKVRKQKLSWLSLGFYYNFH